MVAFLIGAAIGFLAGFEEAKTQLDSLLGM